MTAEEYMATANRQDIISIYDACRNIGILPPDLERNSFEKARRVLGYTRETLENTIIHSRNDEFLYNNKYYAPELSDLLLNATLLAAAHLRTHGIDTPMAIHEWSDETSFVMALATKGEKFDETVAVMSFCNLGGDHFDLFAPFLYGNFVKKYLIDEAAEIAGFESYDAHSLKRYLWTTDYTPYIDKKGLCIPSNSKERPAVPGNILYCADANGMAILSYLGCFEL